MNYKPFQPKLLPFNNFKDKQMLFLKEIIVANKLLAQYDVTLKHSKIHAKLLSIPLCIKEAISSTKIEGNQVTLDSIFEYQISKKQDNRNVLAAIDYITAVNIITDILTAKQLPLSTKLIKKLHYLLMSNNVLDSNKNPGEFRRYQNFISSSNYNIKRAQFIPPCPEVVDELMSNLENYIYLENDDLDELVRLAIIHAQFETIHPFLDGNGRVGRMLIPLYLYFKGIVSHPYFFLSEELEKEKFKYYAYLNNTRYKGDWISWITFFLTSIKNQVNKNLEMLEKINKLYSKEIKELGKFIDSSIINNLLDKIYERPIFTAKKLADETGIKYEKCLRLLKKLENQKIIFSNGAQRNRLYFHYNVLGILR